MTKLARSVHGRSSRLERALSPLGDPRPLVLAALLAVALAPPAAAGHRVLVLTADPGASAGASELIVGLRKELLDAFPTDLDFGLEPLDLVYSSSAAYQAHLAELLEAKYADHPPDLLIAMGGPVLGFVLAERQRLFPRAALLFGYVQREELDAIDLPADVAGLVSDWSYDQQLATALRLRPETRRAVVVLGVGPAEQSHEPTLRRALDRFADRVDLEWWVGLPVAEIEARVSRLPPLTVVLYVGVYRDRSGAAYIPSVVLERLAERANAPIFASLAHFVGQGAVGDGRFDLYELGGVVGAVAVRLLRGESPADVGVVQAPPGALRFDARQLARWAIPRNRLPEGSRVLFEPPSVWRLHRGWILGALSLVVLETLLIAGLVIQSQARRRAERAERRMRDLNTSVVDSLRERIAILDREGTLLAVNRAWQDFARAQSAASIEVGDNYLEAIRRAVERGLEDARQTAECVAAVLAGKASYCSVEYAPGVDEEEHFYEITVHALGREEGGAVVTIDDVTERRRDEERLRLAMESLPVATVLIDTAGEIELVNAETERLFGYRRDELLGRSIDTLVPGRFVPPRERGDGTYAPLEERVGNLRRQFTGRRKDGSEVPIEVGLRPIPTGNGTKLLAAIADLSERRRLEHEAVRLRAETAHFGRLASAGELSAAIAHELNQPLTGILTNAQAAQRFLADAGDGREYLEETLADIAADGRRAGEVIRRLRTLLRKGPIELAPLDLNETVEQVVRLVEQDLHLRGSTLDVELAPDLPRVSGDRVHVQQVVLNLILNGIDAMSGVPAGRRRMLLRTARSAGSTVELEIRDSGPGIAPEALPRLFEPFYTTKPDGMGMGLSIVRSIVESHGGRVSAGNNPSGGAVFTVTLPMAARDGEAA